MTNAIWNSSATAAPPRINDLIGAKLASIVTISTVLYNFVLCLVNTKVHAISPSIVILAELVLIGAALALVWSRSVNLYVILLVVAAYFYTLMIIRFQFDPKILRDILIPIAFYFLGSHLGCARTADKMVTLLIAVAFAAALFEWLAPDTYLRYFDVGRYYVARGTANPEEHELFQGFFNSARFESRTLLPFLGDHRVSGIFLEAPSVGNFAAIVCAWIILRPRGLWNSLTKIAVIMTLVVLADARFGLYFSILILPLYFCSRFIRPTWLFIAPFVVVIALFCYATADGAALGNDLLGRFHYAGQILSKIDLAQVFGLQPSEIKSGVRFASDPVGDSAYTYVLVKIGVLGAAALWALFVYAPVSNRDALRFKTFIAFYYILLLTIAASAFTIKTAALLWFLYGTLSNQTYKQLGLLKRGRRHDA